MTKIESQGSKFDIWYLTFVILLLAFVLRVYRLDAQSMWWDEGHSFQMASAPLVQIPTLAGMDVHPPGYFALLHQWMAIAGYSEFALRYLSLVFSLLTVALLIRFGRVLAGARADRVRTRTAIVVGALAALSPLYVAYAQEVRMYATVTFFALASVYFQWAVLRKGDFPIPPLVSLILAAAAALYTHYFAILLLFFQNLAWLVWVLASHPGRRLRRAVTWLAAQIGILILFLPQLPLAVRQTSAYANPNLNPPEIAEFISRSWLAYSVGVATDPMLATWLAGILAVALGLVLLFQIAGARQGVRKYRLGTTAFLVGWLLIPLLVYFLVLQRRPSFEPRYMLPVTPALVLLLGWGLATGPLAETRAGLHRFGWGWDYWPPWSPLAWGRGLISPTPKLTRMTAPG